MSARPSDKADAVLVVEGYDSSADESQDDDTESEDDQVGVLPQHSPMVDKTSLSASGSERGKLSEACQMDQPPVPVHDFECPVCLQIANFPVKLPCSHIFCFLCVKGFANRSKRCALCRQEVPADFFNDPKLIYKEEIKEKAKTIYDEGYQWFYEGRNGWWQYDDRTSLELERRFKNDDKVFELLIAGFLYVIDLENMRQYRRNDQTRKRKIKRDMQNIPDVKGIAGLKFGENQPNRPNGDGQPANSNVSSNSNMPPPPAPGQPGDGILPSIVNDGGPGPGDDAYLNPPAAPNNTPQTPMTPADSQPGSLSNSTEDLSLQFDSHLHISDHARASPIANAGSSRASPSVEPDDYVEPDEPDELTDPDDSDTDSAADFQGRETCL